MGKSQAAVNIVVAALVIGGALYVVFWPLMEFEQLSGNEREYYIWLIEWVVFDVVFTLGICRREIRTLIRRKPLR
jgi:hypothetical protein